jgi:AraC family transcriptional regulator
MPASNAILPTLVHMQANLDGDLSLGAMAEQAGYSPHHFHRTFRLAVGETPRAHALRLRIERAAFQLSFHADSILDVALASGFASHETFSRAFRRRFGVSPTSYRSDARASIRPRLSAPDRASLDRISSLSTTRIVTLPATHVAFVRHVGPYEAVGADLWDGLLAWAEVNPTVEPQVLLGIGQDSPSTTPAERLRFDAAIRVPGPFVASGLVGHQVLPEGRYALTPHAGSYSELGAAYEQIFTRLLGRDDLTLVGLPVIEIYHATRIDPDRVMNHTDIYVPVTGRES